MTTNTKFKVVFIGDTDAGKTDLIKCLTSDGYRSKGTTSRSMMVRQSYASQFACWDIPGDQKNYLSIYYKDADLFVVCINLSKLKADGTLQATDDKGNIKAFTAAKYAKYLMEHRHLGETPPSMLIVGTKSDKYSNTNEQDTTQKDASEEKAAPGFLEQLQQALDNKKKKSEYVISSATTRDGIDKISKQIEQHRKAKIELTEPQQPKPEQKNKTTSKQKTSSTPSQKSGTSLKKTTTSELPGKRAQDSIEKLLEPEPSNSKLSRLATLFYYPKHYAKKHPYRFTLVMLMLTAGTAGGAVALGLVTSLIYLKYKLSKKSSANTNKQKVPKSQIGSLYSAPIRPIKPPATNKSNASTSSSSTGKDSPMVLASS